MSAAFVWNTFCSEEYLASIVRDGRKGCWVYFNVRYCLPVLTKSRMCLQMLINFSSITFYENTFFICLCRHSESKAMCCKRPKSGKERVKYKERMR
jgi:hypothetical protein